MPQLSPEQLIRLCLDLFDTKRNTIKKHVVTTLKQHKTSPEFEALVSQLDAEKQALVKKAVAEKAARGGFRSFLAQKRKEKTET
jgi:hypothetical protein